MDSKKLVLEGIKYAQDMIEGSMTFLIMTPKGIYASRDKWGRTPCVIGKKDTGYCVCFESFSFLNLGYTTEKELGPGEVVFIDPEGYEVKIPARREMRICSFLWIYYGFPASSYEGLNVEDMRYGCGRKLAERDLRRGNIHPDCVAGVPDSGVAHAIGYANRSNVPYSRPFVKYTPTWPRSFMPTQQSRRDLIAKMKLIPIHELIAGKKLLLIDDSALHGCRDLKILAESEEAGVLLCMSRDGRMIFIMGHAEYDRNTLRDEYFRDARKGLGTAIPINYFPDDNPDNKPLLEWRAHSYLLYSNWLNYYVYQRTPYDLNEIR